MKKTWILVATASNAEIYSCDNRNAPLVPVTSLSHEASRVLRQELAADEPGRVFDCFGSGRHGMDPENAVRAEEAARFAREIAGQLETGERKHEFEELAVIAEPGFLGDLRKAFKKHLSGRVTVAVPKNLVGHDPQEIRNQLPGMW